MLAYSDVPRAGEIALMTVSPSCRNEHHIQSRGSSEHQRRQWQRTTTALETEDWTLRQPWKHFDRKVEIAQQVKSNHLLAHFLTGRKHGD